MSDDDHAEDGASKREKLAATVAVMPELRHAKVAAQYTSRTTQWPLDEMSVVHAYQDVTREVRGHDLAMASNMLTSQALTLDAVFTDMLSRSSLNLGQYPEAAERYLRMALKAQAQSRATIEALTRLHQPREQIVRHVTVHEGGQAIVADQFHHHQQQQQPGQGANEQHAEQSHAQSPSVAPLPGPDPLGHAVPIPGRARQGTMQDARRDQSRCSEGEPERMEARR
jgi:hypothetical protein